MVLAGTFAVLTLAGISQTREIGQRVADALDHRGGPERGRERTSRWIINSITASPA